MTSETHQGTDHVDNRRRRRSLSAHERLALRDKLEVDHAAAELACTAGADWIRAHFGRDTIGQADEATVRQLAKLAMGALAQVAAEIDTERALIAQLLLLSEEAATLAGLIATTNAKALEAWQLLAAAQADLRGSTQ